MGDDHDRRAEESLLRQQGPGTRRGRGDHGRPALAVGHWILSHSRRRYQLGGKPLNTKKPFFFLLSEIECVLS